MDEEKTILGFCIVCCLVKDREKSIPAFEEFDFKEKDFGSRPLFNLFKKLMNRNWTTWKPSELKTINMISEYLPTTDNYRYYAEELYSLNKVT